jgi:hypothetical protein
MDMQIYTGTYTQHIHIYWTYRIMNVHTYAFIHFVYVYVCTYIMISDTC